MLCLLKKPDLVHIAKSLQTQGDVDSGVYQEVLVPISAILDYYSAISVRLNDELLNFAEFRLRRQKRYFRNITVNLHLRLV